MSDYNHSVFVNCPFDPRYKRILEAVVFAVQDCGYVARSALERRDSMELRMDKLVSLIEESRLGIHDISRTQLDADSDLPRFNMPLELALFLGAKVFGGGQHQTKVGLILDSKPFRYNVYASDLSGFDAYSHGNKEKEAIRQVRDWLAKHEGPATVLPGGDLLFRRYASFRQQLPTACTSAGLSLKEVEFTTYCRLLDQWLRKNKDWTPWMIPA